METFVLTCMIVCLIVIVTVDVKQKRHKYLNEGR
jgi:hypothetical protein